MKNKVNNLKWYALVREDNNDSKVKLYNIFNNRWVFDDVNKFLKDDLSKEEFIKEIDKTFKYAFTSKFEHEIFIGSPFDDKIYGKFNVYDQLKPNIENLVDYIFINMKGE